MASVQERLNLKRQSLSDKWSAKERLLLASAVAFSGDQNWMSVSRALKMICNDSNRPADWFSQKFCAIEYGKLLENVETPKRKKRTASERDSVAADTPGESIVRKLTQERIEELQKIIDEEQREFNKLRDEVLFLQSGNADEAAIMQMWEQIEVEKKQKEQEQQMREKWMREREERKLEMERLWRPSLAYQQQSGQSPKSASPQLKTKADHLEMMDVEEVSPQKAGTSPLLTSLLKSPSPAPNANQNLHPTMSSPSSRAAPTITNLLTSSVPVSMLPLDTPPPQYQSMQALFPNTTQSPAAQAPTLTKLLDPRPPVTAEPSSKSTTSDFGQQPFSNQQMLESNFNIGNENDENSDGKDEENLMEVFKNLIPDDLADILSDNNEMILNPELLDEDKMLVESLMNEAEGLPIDDVEAEPEAAKLEPDEPVDKADIVEPEQTGEMFVADHDAIGDQPEVVPASTDNVVVIDDSPTSEEKPSSEGVISDAEPLAEIEENVVMEILSDEDEKQAVVEEFTKNDVESIAEERAEQVTPETETSQDTIEPISEESNEPPPEQISETDKPKHSEPEPSVADQKHSELTVEKIEDSHSSIEPLTDQVSCEMPQLDAKDDNSNVKEVSLVQKDVEPIIPNEMPNEVKIKEEIIEGAEEKHKETESRPERKISSDEEIFEDAKDTMDVVEPVEMKPLALQDKYSATIIDTDDDSPIEVIKEDKIGKTKRDYSRKKPEIVVTDTSKSGEDRQKSGEDEPKESRVGFNTRMKAKEQRDGSESPMVAPIDDDLSSDNAPPRTRRRQSSTPLTETPSALTPTDDREYRAWKKSILAVYSRLISHKHATMFMRSPTDDAYKAVILRPIDLHTIKKHIESGSIRSTAEFFCNLLLMCQNAIMFYKKGHSTHIAAREFMDECVKALEVEKAKDDGDKQPVAVVALATPSSSVVQSGSTSSSSTNSPVVKRPGRKSQRLPQNS